jgi:[protein-PII] uridylyltransferase
MLTPIPKTQAPPDTLRLGLLRHYEELATRLSVGEDGLALGRVHAKCLDLMMIARFGEASAGRPQPFRMALAAVGSHGRGAVALRSDADVRVLVPPRTDPREAEAFVESLLYPLWDAGLSVGHQVMEESEALALAQEDLTAATALLDLRHLAGDPEPCKSILARAWSGVFAEGNLGGFVDRLDEETDARHERFGGSLFLLEPDVKSAAGGLRDLDGARWAARARFRVADSVVDGGAMTGSGGEARDGRGPSSAHPALSVWAELVRLGVLVPHEQEEMAAAEEFLWRVRNRLHAHAGRRSDRLTFDEQESIAIEMGYAKAGEARAPAAERFMQDYYLHARTITQSRERIFERVRVPKKHLAPKPEVDLGGGVRLFDGSMTHGGPAELARDPALALRVYVACVQKGATVHPYAKNAIARAAADAAWCEALRASREAASLFVDLVCTVASSRHKRGSILGELHDVGLLLAMIPEFAPVTGRVHHDVYHVFTVDVHSVAAVDCLRALARGELLQEHPMASRLAAEIARPRPLFLATLLHDVGKGYPDETGSRKNHSESGAQLCDRILPRLGLLPEDVKEARSLVAQHLAMYRIATRRDVDDPATVEEFCRPIEGREALRDLYLLTVADLTTTSPTAMTSWKARMLEELYLAADSFLAHTEARGQGHDARLDGVRTEVKRLWRSDPAFLTAFVASMPDRYLLANAPEAIVAHALVARERGNLPVHAAIVPPGHHDFAELCVVAEDRPGLLARIAAAITAGRFEVLAAQVYSRTFGVSHPAVEAVDLFWVRDRVDGVEGVRRGMPRLLRDLVDVCSLDVAPEALLAARTGSASRWRERPSPAVETKVMIDDRASPRHTVIEVFAKDRPGLLFTLAHAIEKLGLSIALSKINTEGTRVADVFYVSELDGAKVTGAERFKQIRETLLAAIG